jgi:plasmid stability protein
MASITIRNLDERTKERLRIRAAHHKRSIAEEARQILLQALGDDVAQPVHLAERIRRRFAPLGGLDLKLPRRR